MGSIFRSADSAGIAKIWLTGYTPAPFDQFRRANKEIAKTALGAEKIVPWQKRENIFELITGLKRSGCQIWALEQHNKSIDYREAKLLKPMALIVGNEVEGVEAKVLSKCDQIIEIPLRGKKESLNVSVAVGVAVFKLIED